MVLVFQVTPSALYMIRFPVPVAATATKIPFPNATETQLLFAIPVLDDQFLPSLLYMTPSPFVDEPTATKVPFPYATEFQALPFAAF